MSRVKTTPMIKATMIFIRVYIITMLVLIAIKFLRTIL